MPLIFLLCIFSYISVTLDFTGEPIPRRLTPPPDAIDYYTDAKNRGYLADPEEIARERCILAQKYGYDLPDINNDPMVSRSTVLKVHQIS